MSTNAEEFGRWAGATDPMAILHADGWNRPCARSQRALRLFAVANFRLFLQWTKSVPPTPVEEAHLRVAVQCADHGWDGQQRDRAWMAMMRRFPVKGYADAASRPRAMATTHAAHPDAMVAARHSAQLWETEVPGCMSQVFGRQVATSLLRTIQGNPYAREEGWALCFGCWSQATRASLLGGPSCGHSQLDAWMGTQAGRHARAVVRQAVLTGDMAGLPIAADALEEAGCQEPFLHALRSAARRMVTCVSCRGSGYRPDVGLPSHANDECLSCWGRGTFDLPWVRGDRTLDRLAGLG